MLWSARRWRGVRALANTLASASVAAAAQAPVDFDRDVRPLLADRCFRCHGPDAAGRKKDLRLDDEASAKGVRGGRAALVPGDLAGSELWRRVNASDDDRMPPADSGLSLDTREIALLGRWIEQGAEYAQHWALRPLPDVVPVPAAPAGARAHNPIDAFVQDRLRREGLAPAPPASKERLVRRATLTLTGLPPAPADVDAFVADARPDALARVVDRLLASPRYGERMAVDWLDAARYADTYGYQADAYRAVWPWRDWVVGAFQSNLPFDQFLTWQIAGDLLPDATRAQVLATCFNRLHRQTNEGGSVEEEFRVEYVCDRVETLGSAVLGLTLGCARCHDHKFDPISQREFYQLFALFDDIDESGLYSHFTDAVPTPALPLPSREQEQDLAAAQAEVDRLEALARAAADRAATPAPGAAAGGALPGCTGHFDCDAIAGGEIDNRARPDAPGVVALAPRVVSGRTGNALRFDGECSVACKGVADFTRDDPFTIALWLKVDTLPDRAVVLHRSRAWTDAGSRGYELLLEEGRPSFALVHFWPGNAARIRVRQPLLTGRWTHLAVAHDGSGRAAGMRVFVDGAVAACEIVRDRLTKDITGGGADALVIGARFRDRGLAGGEVDELQVYARALSAPEVDLLARLPEGGAAKPSEPASDAAPAPRSSPPPSDLAAQLHAARRRRTQLADHVPEVMVMRDDCPRTAFVLARGAYDARGEPVEPGVPASLPAWPAGTRRDRLGLARWLTDPRHPLTARVAVNRIWQMHFGQGLVRTQEDFGVQGARPTHPELLDYLARAFVASGWDVHALHRMILGSSTWQQDSRATPALRERDPDNELLARGPSFRLPAETVRDAALFAGGLLVEKLGGPPVKPYQPPGLWEEKSGASYTRDAGEGSHRRSLYTFWKRTSPPPAMTLFDAPDREVCAQRRQRTSTPLQALVLMNDPQFVEAARGLAARALRTHGGDVAASVHTMARVVLSEAPTPATIATLTAFWHAQAAHFAGDHAGATALLAIGDLPADPGLDAVAWAAGTLVASAIFSLDAAIVLR